MVMVISVSLIFDTGDTYSCYSNKGESVKLEYHIFKRNIRSITKGLAVSGFGIVQYSVRIEIGRMIELQTQVYYIYGLPKDLHII